MNGSPFACPVTTVRAVAPVVVKPNDVVMSNEPKKRLVDTGLAYCMMIRPVERVFRDSD